MAAKLLTAAGGGITLDAASTATDKTLTLPARTGNVAVDGPAFAATDTATTATAGVTTKVVFDTTLFDTASAFDGSKFQPLVAGYYQVNLIITATQLSTGSTMQSIIYKNGSTYIGVANYCLNGFTPSVCVSTLLYLNGSTDYIEAYGRNAGTANFGVANFSASFVRGA